MQQPQVLVSLFSYEKKANAYMYVSTILMSFGRAATLTYSGLLQIVVPPQPLIPACTAGLF
jgi:hypothetical protein